LQNKEKKKDSLKKNQGGDDSESSSSECSRDLIHIPQQYHTSKQNDSPNVINVTAKSETTSKSLPLKSDYSEKQDLHKISFSNNKSSTSVVSSSNSSNSNKTDSSSKKHSDDTVNNFVMSIPYPLMDISNSCSLVLNKYLSQSIPSGKNKKEKGSKGKGRSSKKYDDDLPEKIGKSALTKSEAEIDPKDIQSSDSSSSQNENQRKYPFSTPFAKLAPIIVFNETSTPEKIGGDSSNISQPKFSCCSSPGSINNTLPLKSRFTEEDDEISDSDDNLPERESRNKLGENEEVGDFSEEDLLKYKSSLADGIG
jgi:hypothetical protein